MFNAFLDIGVVFGESLRVVYGAQVRGITRSLTFHALLTSYAKSLNPITQVKFNISMKKVILRISMEKGKLPCLQKHSTFLIFWSLAIFPPPSENKDSTGMGDFNIPPAAN